MTILIRDEQRTTVSGGVSNADATVVLPIKIDSVTGRVLTTTAGGSGTVTGVDTGTGLTGGPITTTGTVALDSKLSPMDTLAGNSLKFLRVNVGETAVEYATPSAGLTVGSSTITSGTNTRILYDNSGVLGEYTLTGTGTVVAMQTSPTFLTSVTMSAANIITDTTTGTKIGTATTQKLGFFNATPIVQPTGDVITALQNLGLGATLTVAATTITSRTLWGQTYDGSANVTGSLTSVGDITGGASSMVITAGTGASRTLTLRTTTSGSTATAALTLDATQGSTFGGDLTISAHNIITDTTTGIKIGTGTTQKLGFYNATPVVQQTGDVITGLQNLGLMASATINATTIATATESTDTTCFPVFVTASGTQTLAAKTNTTLTYNSNTNDLGVTKLNGLTVTTSTGTFTLTNAKTLSVSNTLTLAGTDGTTMTFPATSASVARTDAAQTFTGTQTFSEVVMTANAIAASSNAATVPVTSGRNIVTNSSAATLTITLTTAGAVNMQTVIVQILDFSAVAQTIAWVNTENSTVTAPTTSNGSTSLPLTVGFIYNSSTSKWRCIASA